MQEGQQLLTRFEIVAKQGNLKDMQRLALDISQNYEARLLLKRPKYANIAKSYHDLWLDPQTGLMEKVIGRTKDKLRWQYGVDITDKIAPVRNIPEPGKLPSAPMDFDVGLLTKDPEQAVAWLHKLGGPSGIQKFQSNLDDALNASLIEIAAEEFDIPPGFIKPKKFPLLVGTTPWHKESFKDAAVLFPKGVPGKDLVQQTADVAKIKVDEFAKLAEGKEISLGSAYIESARGTVKDLEKVERVFEELERRTGTKIQWTERHQYIIKKLKEMSQGVDAAGNIIDPFAINKAIEAELGKDTFGACKELLDKMEEAWRLAPSPMQELWYKLFGRYLSQEEMGKASLAMLDGKMELLPEKARDLQNQLRKMAVCKELMLVKRDPQQFLKLLGETFPQLTLDANNEALLEFIRKLDTLSEKELSQFLGDEGGRIIYQIRQKFPPPARQKVQAKFGSSKWSFWDRENWTNLGDGKVVAVDGVIRVAAAFYQTAEIVGQGLSPEEENRKLLEAWTTAVPIVGDLFQGIISAAEGAGAYAGGGGFEGDKFVKAGLWTVIGISSCVPALQIPAMIAGLGMAGIDLLPATINIQRDKAIIEAWVASGNWDEGRGLLKGLFDAQKTSRPLDRLAEDGEVNYQTGLPGVTIRRSLYEFAARNSLPQDQKAESFKAAIKNLYSDFKLEEALLEKPEHGRTLMAAKIRDTGGNPGRNLGMSLFVKLQKTYLEAAKEAARELAKAAEQEYQARHMVGDALDLDRQLEALGKRLGLPLLQNVNDIFKSFSTMLAEIAKTPWVRESLNLRVVEAKKKYLAGYLAIEEKLGKLTGEMKQLGLEPPRGWNLCGFLDIDAPRIDGLVDAYRVDAIGQARKNAQAIHAAVAKQPKYLFDVRNACDLDLFRKLAQIRIRLVHSRDMLLLTDQWAGKTSAAEKSRDEVLRKAQNAARDQSAFLQAKDGLWNSYESAYAWSKKTWEGSNVLAEARQQLQERLKKLEKEYADALAAGKVQMAACLQTGLQAAIELSAPQPAANRPFTATLVIKQGKMPEGAAVQWRVSGGVKLEKAAGLSASLVALADGQVIATVKQKDKTIGEFTAPVSLKKEVITGVIELTPKQPAVNQKVTATLAIKEGQIPTDAEPQWRTSGGVKLEQARGLTANLMVQGNGQVIVALVQKDKVIQEFSAPVTVKQDDLEAVIELSNPTPPANQQINASLVFRKGQLPQGAGIKWRTSGGLVLQKDQGQSVSLVARSDGQVVAALIKDGKTIKEFAAAVAVKQQEKAEETPTGKMENGVYKFKLTAPQSVRYSEIFKVKAALPAEVAARAAEYSWIIGASLEKGVSGPARGAILDRPDRPSGYTSFNEVQAQFNAGSLAGDNPKTGKLTVSVNGKDGRQVAEGEAMVQLTPESLAASYPDTWKVGRVNTATNVELSKTTDKLRDPAKKGKSFNDYSQTMTFFKAYVTSSSDADLAKDIASRGKPFSLGDFKGFLLEEPPGGTNLKAVAKGYANKGMVRIYVEGTVSHKIIRYSVEEEQQQLDKGLDVLQMHWREMQAIIKSVKFGPGGGLTSYPGEKDPTGVAKEPDKPKPLKVSLAAGKLQLLAGEKAAVQAKVENPDPQDQPLTYTWTGEHEGQGASVGFSSAKPGKYTLKVEVKSPKGAVGTASLEMEVSGAKAEIIKVSPPGSSIPVGGKAAFQVKFTGTPGKSYIYRWQPHPEAAWDNQEGPGVQATAVFKRPGPVKVWVTVLEKKGAALTTVAESPQLSLEVVKPQLKLSFAPARPRIGEEVRARVEVTPAPPDLSLRWQPLPANAQLLRQSQDGREITLTLKDDKPVAVKVLALVKGIGDSLGEASGTVQAAGFQVQAKVIGPLGPAPVKWDPVKGGQVADPKAIAIHQNVRVQASVTPEPAKGPVRYRWSVNEDSHIQQGQFSSEILVNRNRTGTCQVTVVAEDGEGRKLGSATTSFAVTADQGVNSKELREAAIKRAAEGKLDEAINLAEQAAKMEPTSTANANLVKKLREEKALVLQQVEKTKALIGQGKIAEATKELAVAQSLHPRYPPVVEATRLLDQLKTADKGSDREKAAAKLTQAKDLAARQQLTEAIRLGEEAVKLNPGNAEASKLVKNWKAQKLRQEGEALQQQGKLPEAIGKYQQSLSYYPDAKLEALIRTLQAKQAEGTQAKADQLWAQGMALERQGDLNGALRKFEEAYRVVPNQNAKGQIENLKARISQSQDKQQKQAQYNRLLSEGVALGNKGDVQGAVRKFQEANRLIPSKELQGKIEQLQAATSQSQNKQQKQALADQLWAEGIALERRGDLNGALRKFEEAYRVVPNQNAKGQIDNLKAKISQKTSTGQQEKKSDSSKDKQPWMTDEKREGIKKSIMEEWKR
jgi:hypothetical protein